MSAAIVHFEIQVSDIERSQKFYTNVFDWKIEKYQGTEYYGVWTGRSKYPNGSIVGMDGGLQVREGQADTVGLLNAFLCTVGIENIDQTLEKIDGAGGTILKPKSAFPGVGWQALCADPDGNRFSLMQNDTSAE